MGENEIRTLIDGWGERWGLPGLAARVTVETSPRMRRMLGSCDPARGRVKLNLLLFHEDNRDLLLETLCHEVAHAAAYRIHGRRVRPHGREWRALLTAAGFPPRARIPVAEIGGALPPRRRAPYLYRHVCRDCARVFTARRTDRRWRCRPCSEAGRSGLFTVLRRRAG